MNFITTFKYKLLFCSLLTFLLIGCGGGNGQINASARQPLTYASAKQMWNEATPQSYRFTLTNSCFCIPESPIVIIVQNNKVTNAFYADTLTGVSLERLQSLPTITGLFMIADDAYAGSAAQVDVSFNQSKGYLESVYIDYSRMIADEEVGYKVSDFSADSTLQRKVSVVIYMNSKQCEGGGQSLASLQTQLTAAGVPVINASCGVDGNAYAAVCGASDGRIGIFDILTSQTAPPLPQGFLPMGNLPDAQVIPCK